MPHFYHQYTERLDEYRGVTSGSGRVVGKREVEVRRRTLPAQVPVGA